MFGIREDNSETARWLVELEVKGLRLVQFEDLRPGVRLVAFDSYEAARQWISHDPSIDGAVVVEFKLVGDTLVIVPAP